MPLHRRSDSPHAQVLEAVPGISDVVWTTLARLDGTRERQRLVFVSAEPRAGTTVVAAATAIGLLQNRRVPVCLVETNVRAPAVAGYLGLRPTGLTDMLAGRAGLEECLQQPRGCNGLYVLPAGAARAPIPGEFTTEAFRTIVDGLAEIADYLLIDAPPVLDHLESRLLLRNTDGVLLVLRSGSTRTADIEHACGILSESGAPVLGAIFNAYEPAGPFDRKTFARTTSVAAQAAVSANYVWVEPRAEAQASEDEAEPARSFDNGFTFAPSAAAIPTGSIPEDVHRRQIELLERRIAKLTRHLSKAEENLQRMAALRGDDQGIASIYRTVQGLSPEERALAFKQKLMQKIFLANLELKNTIARRH